MDRAVSEDLRHQRKSVIILWTNSCVCRCACAVGVLVCFFHVAPKVYVHEKTCSYILPYIFLR